MRERKDVYKLPENDDTLTWYGKAVLAMKKKPPTDPTSWWFQGAIHGFQGNLPVWSGVSPLPSESIRYEYWNQCQHGSWYFLPWHRMYLAFFEQIIAQTVADLGGPAGWSLPFWNYSDTANPKALTIPEAFTSPADANNGLWMKGRQSNVLQERYVTLGALEVIPYTGDGITSQLGFGGPETTFSHSGRTHGRLESLPHDMVHVMIGGAMGDPRSAALDPIFWLHHANIDRLWQVWLNKGNRINPIKPSWLDYGFEFHDKNGQSAKLTCREVEDTTKILDGYSYQGVPTNAPVQEMATLQNIQREVELTQMPLEVVGATNQPQSLGSDKTVAALNMAPARHKKSSFKRMGAAIPQPEQTFLHFENVTGLGVPPIYDVYINVNDDITKEEHYAGSLGFFGLEEASIPNEHHSGSGQHFALDVTSLIKKLKSDANWKEDELDVVMEPTRPLDSDTSLIVGRISLYTA